MKFNLGDYDLAYFSLGGLGLGAFHLDFDLIPKIRGITSVQGNSECS